MPARKGALRRRRPRESAYEGEHQRLAAHRDRLAYRREQQFRSRRLRADLRDLRRSRRVTPGLGLARDLRDRNPHDGSGRLPTGTTAVSGGGYSDSSSVVVETGSTAPQSTTGWNFYENNDSGSTRASPLWRSAFSSKLTAAARNRREQCAGVHRGQLFGAPPGATSSSTRWVRFKSAPLDPSSSRRSANSRIPTVISSAAT